MPTVADVAARRVGIRIPFDQARVRRFYERMPELFAAGHDPVDTVYQRLLYGVAHDFTPDHLRAIDDAFGVAHPEWGTENKASAIRLLDAMRYPATDALTRLRAVPGLTLTTVSLYLHFFHHVYPIFDQDSCRGLAALGFEIPFTRLRDPDTYGLYIAAVETLKECAPFWSFPERNLSLQRVVQAALSTHV